MASSSYTGQGALQPLPSKSLSNKRTISAYSLPDILVQDRFTLRSSEDVGLPVLKVSKERPWSHHVLTGCFLPLLQTGKLQPRRLAFSKDLRNILVTTNKIRSIKGLFKAATGREASAKVIPLLSVDRIQRGTNSKRFLHAEEVHASSEHADLMSKLMKGEAGVSLSIVYRSVDTHGLEMLDLVVPSLGDYEVLLSALEDLVAISREDRQHYTTDVQLLHYYWTEMKKEWEDSLSLSEWMNLTDKLHVPLKKSLLTEMFRDKCAAKDCQKLSLPDIGLLLDQVKRKAVPPEYNPLEDIWEELVRTDPMPAVGLQSNDNDTASLEMSLCQDLHESISSVAFLSFLRSHQKEYNMQLEDALDLIHLLNQQKTAGDWCPVDTNELGVMDRLPKSRFMAYLASDANDLLDSMYGKVGVDDMSHPLSHYWIHTSHDTYLKSLSDSFNGKSAYVKAKGRHDIVDAQAYTTALLRGVRCLELDLWDGPLGEPVIARNEPADEGGEDKWIPLFVVLRSILHFLEQHPYSFPVVLNIENHCSWDVQKKVAQDLHETFGASRLIVIPNEDVDLTDDDMVLPSPESARGKVIIMGKRSRLTTSTVINDDFDADNNEWEPVVASVDVFRDTSEYDRENLGIVIGFDVKGPLRTQDPNAVVPTPDEIYRTATKDAQDAQRELEEAKQREAELVRQADEQETLTAQLTLQAGLRPSEVKQRAAQAAGASNEGEDVLLSSEEKSTKEEGVEIHEVLPDSIEGVKYRFAEAAQEATEAARQLLVCEEKLKSAEKLYQRALTDLMLSRQAEEEIVEKAKRAAAEARTQREHAETAKERVEQVRELLRNSQNKSSSAGTVVQTASTEAKISEKRAADAEARAKRAQTVAERDRHRADEENRLEEEMEQEVSDMHEECVEAGEVSKAARLRVEKATAMLERANEQIKLIENSSQYRQEMMNQHDNFSPRKVGPFVAKHEAKVEERNRCLELIKEATEEHSSAEAARARLQAKFEDKAQAWRSQADKAAQVRRTADRSANVAEELLEHAEEEREAAALRQVAHQKAEAAVEAGDSHKASSEAQLAEAERGAAEAARIAVQSRHRAERLAKEAEIAKDQSCAENEVESTKWELRQAKGAYDAARMLKEKKDEVMAIEKRRLDTDAELFRTAERDAAVDTDRIRVEPLHEQEAIVAYNTALMLRKEANNATRKTEIATHNAESKLIIAKRAREYKEHKEMSVEIPSTLSKMTLLHKTRFKQWDISLALSNANVHSLAQSVLLKMLGSDTQRERLQFGLFTRDHLCRVFPSWPEILDKSTFNYDPVLAWSLGCQLVAMNFHSPSSDENLLVADGLFRKNGSCGYVLKPKFLTHGENDDDDDDEPVKEQTWSFKVLAGMNLPRSERRSTTKPFVTVSLHTGSKDEARSIYRTNTVLHNGLNPVWDKTKTIKLLIKNPQVAMVSFGVWNKVDDRTDEFIGGAAVPASCLREGYRSVPLFAADNSRLGPHAYASLVVNALRR